MLAGRSELAADSHLRRKRSELAPGLLKQVKKLRRKVSLPLAVGFGNLPDLRARVRALHGMRDDRGFLAVVLAAKRIANILKDTREHEFREELLEEDAERELFTASRDLRAESEPDRSSADDPAHALSNRPTDGDGRRPGRAAKGVAE